MLKRFAIAIMMILTAFGGGLNVSVAFAKAPAMDMNQMAEMGMDMSDCLERHSKGLPCDSMQDSCCTQMGSACSPFSLNLPSSNTSLSQLPSKMLFSTQIAQLHGFSPDLTTPPPKI